MEQKVKSPFAHFRALGLLRLRAEIETLCASIQAGFHPTQQGYFPFLHD